MTTTKKQTSTAKSSAGFVFKNITKSAIKIGDSLFSMTVPAGMEMEVPERLESSAKLVEAEMKKAAKVKG